MDKYEDHNMKPILFHRKIGLLLLLAVFFVPTACDQEAVSSENAADFENESMTGTVQVDLRQPGREAILIRGNEWIYGIPGFGDNSFHAISGEYLLQTASQPRTGTREGNDFKVYLSPELFYFSDEWETRRGTGTMQVFERHVGGEFIAAAMLDDGRGVLWAAVFQFPFGLEGAALNDDSFLQMLRAWSSRLLYFMSLARSIGEISIPAVVEF